MEFVEKCTMLRNHAGNELREYLIKKALESYIEGKISRWKLQGCLE